jgi:hypothetical protein
MSDEDVIVHNKELLQKLRAESDIRDDSRREDNSRVFGNGHVESRTSSNNKSPGSGDATTLRDVTRQGRESARAKDARELDRTTETVQSRVRPVNRQSKHAIEDTSYDDRRTKEPIKFQLKNPFNFKETTKKPIKLFSKPEAELEHDKLVEIYFRGSSLLDDILEIIVKDHEPVQIWQLDESEAEMLAEMHLSRAQVNEDSARSARQMLALYDRLYMYILAAPRLVSTSKHVKEHGGFSFK